MYILDLFDSIPHSFRNPNTLVLFHTFQFTEIMFHKKIISINLSIINNDIEKIYLRENIDI